MKVQSPMGEWDVKFSSWYSISCPMDRYLIFQWKATHGDVTVGDGVSYYIGLSGSDEEISRQAKKLMLHQIHNTLDDMTEEKLTTLKSHP